MNNSKELCRLILCTSLGDRAIGRQLDRSGSTVGVWRRRLSELGRSWADLADLGEAEIMRLVHPARWRPRKNFVIPDWAALLAELRSQKGMTKGLLYEEYSRGDPGPGRCFMSERLFLRRFAEFQGSRDLVLRQTHKPGEAAFVDFNGAKFRIRPEKGEPWWAEVFVGVLGHSNYTYGEALPSQKLPEVIGVHQRCYEYFRGVPQLTVPDNMKTAVTKPRRAGEAAILNPTYAEMAAHVGTVVMAARAKKPKDKAKAEAGVRWFTARVMAPLRRGIYRTVAEANTAIWSQLAVFNDTPLAADANLTRRKLWESADQPALRPLPVAPFTFGEWRTQTLGPDYHVLWNGHAYSVPYRYIGERVNVRVSERIIEIYHQSRRIASHLRAHQSGQTTAPEHQPEHHRQWREGRPEFHLSWAEGVGPATHEVVRRLLERDVSALIRNQGLQHLRQLAREHGKDRFEAACARAIVIGEPSTRFIRETLENRMEHASFAAPPLPAPAIHENIRGADYFS